LSSQWPFGDSVQSESFVQFMKAPLSGAEQLPPPERGSNVGQLTFARRRMVPPAQVSNPVSTPPTPPMTMAVGFVQGCLVHEVGTGPASRGGNGPGGAGGGTGTTPPSSPGGSPMGLSCPASSPPGAPWTTVILPPQAPSSPRAPSKAVVTESTELYLRMEGVAPRLAKASLVPAAREGTGRRNAADFSAFPRTRALSRVPL
jgi:hypothetical protein